MKKKGMVWLALFLVFLAGNAIALDASEGKAETGVLKVAISGFRNDKGDAKIAVFNAKEDFGGNGKAFKTAALPIRNGKAEWVLGDLSFGVYAIKVFHDENGNGKLDKNTFGQPKEEYGFSNNARGAFGPPDYEEAKFVFNKPATAIAITVE